MSVIRKDPEIIIGRLPEVGDTIFQTNGLNVFESTVRRIYYETEAITFDADAIGSSVFLTREEAEERTMHLTLEGTDDHDGET